MDKQTERIVYGVLSAFGIGGLIWLIAKPNTAQARTNMPPYVPPSTGGGSIMDQAIAAGMLYPPFSPQANTLFTDAATRAGLPSAWGTDNGLHQILTKESGGWVGRPNYQFGDLSQLFQWRRWPEVWTAIKNGTWRTMLAEPYKSQSAGKQSSATGLGQLTSTNIRDMDYYPSRLNGIGNATEEAIGMLKYIKDRYQTPANAWANYGKGHEGY